VQTKPGDDRVEVIQALIDSRGAKLYLEIGVQSGATFFWIKARRKLAVDPRFAFGRLDKLRWIRWNPHNVFNEYYAVPSDEFFSARAMMLARRGLDVVFVDGLHTYEQSLRDIENSLQYLRPDGVIVVDDCIPPNEPASRPTRPSGNAPWCGDVWKALVHLRSTRRDLRVFVLDCVFGLGIVTKEPARTMLRYTEREIDALSFDDFKSLREDLLDLKPKKYLSEFLEERRRKSD